jgi:hypothetical protein
MQRVRRRIEELARLFPLKPAITPGEVIRRTAVQRMSGEDLLVLRRMILAGRTLLSCNERESAAVAAYRSAVESVIHSAENGAKRCTGTRLPDY